MSDTFDHPNLWKDETKTQGLKLFGCRVRPPEEGEEFFLAGQQVSTAGKTFRAWDAIRELLTGEDLFCEPQETGDCVAVSAADLLEAIQLIEIWNGEAEDFHPIHASYLYAAGREGIGKGRLRGGAGSFGGWQAQAVAGKYGALRMDMQDVPKYSGKLSDAWGDGRKHKSTSWHDWTEYADDHQIRKTAYVKSWTQLVDAVANGHLCTMASDLAWEMKPRSDGFHRKRGSWAHQMGIWAISDDRRKPWAGVHNNWGDVHGVVRDFETEENWPSGMIRARPDDLEAAFRNGEVIAWSGFDGFVDRRVDWEAWSLA